MSKKTLTKADLKRMEDLSKKIAADKKQSALDKTKALKMKKQVEAEQKKLAAQWKELKNQKKQHQDNVKFQKNNAAKDAKKSDKGGGGGNNKKLREDVLNFKQKFNAEGKRAREFKQRVDQLTAENKVLQKKLKNLQGRKEKGEDPRIKHMAHEIKKLKDQIRLLLIELNKKRRWFQRCIKSFRSSRQKWIAKQEEAMKKKGVLIKYVFLDDVAQIKQYAEPNSNKKGGKTKFRNKIKVKAKDGGVIVLHDVEIVVLDMNDDDDDDDGNSKNGKKGKKKKKKKGNMGDKMEEMESYIADLQKEFDMDNDKLYDDDDRKELPSDDESIWDDIENANDLDSDMEPPKVDAIKANAKPIASNGSAGKTPKKGKKSPRKSPSATPTTPNKKGKKQSSPTKKDKNKLGFDAAVNNDYNDNNDNLAPYLQAPKSIDTTDADALQAQVVYLTQEMDARCDDLEKLKEIVSDPEKYPDPKKEANLYLLQINKRGDDLVNKLDKELHASNINDVKDGNKQWQLMFGNLALTISKNGALFNKLIDVFEDYLKELKGRVVDLNTVNNTFYFDKSNDNDNEDDNEDDNENKENGYSSLKNTVTERHNEIQTKYSELKSNEDNDAAEEDAQNEKDNYGAENKENEARDEKTKKIQDVRNGLISCNDDWRGLIDTCATDLGNATAEKDKFVGVLNGDMDELKTLLDLIVKIPKRKILQRDDDDADNNDDNEQENQAVDDAADDANDNADYDN